MSIGGSKEKTPDPTASERALASRAVNEWNDYITRYVPIENRYIQQIQNNKYEKRDAKGMAAAEAAIQTAGQEREAIRGGANPYELQQTYDDKARARGLGVASAETAADMQQQRELQRVVTFGRNLADDSKRGLTSAVQDDLRGLQAENEAYWQLRAARRSAAGKIAGTAAFGARKAGLFGRGAGTAEEKIF